MYRIKNVTDHKVMFQDIQEKKILIDPGKEIEHEFPSPFGYGKRLVIEEIKGKPQDKPKEVK